MHTGKILIAILASTLCGSAAFGQSQTPAGMAGPVRPTADPSPYGSVPKWDGSIRNSNGALALNEKLTARLKALLPEGTDLRAASRGFGELKEFVATVHVANNLQVAFYDVKHKMANGSAKELQKAIHQLKPDLDPKAEAKKANEQAKQDIKESKHS
jgi:hypothetical protein